MTRKIDATRPFYAVVGAGDLAVEFARAYANDVQTRFAKVELEPKVLRDQARSVVEARVAELQADAKALPAKVESFTNETVAELTDAYGDLAIRGRGLVNRIRKQQATQDAKAAGKTTVAKAKTAKTQTTKSAKSAGKTTGETAKRNTKSTSTAAKKTAAAGTQAASDAADKVGN